MIHIVDYGLGNVGAFRTLYDRLSIPAVSATTADELREADHILLPGVGAFDHAMDLLVKSGMFDVLNELVLVKKVPVLGVCVGMQIMGNRSEEGRSNGLGWIEGTIRSLSTRPGSNHGLPLPHMGWNDVEVTRSMEIFENLERPRYYFLHSYYFDNSDAADCLATSQYGGAFTCAVQRENIWGVQFHPEKSHSFGMTLLKNFAEV